MFEQRLRELEERVLASQTLPVRPKGRKAKSCTPPPVEQGKNQSKPR